MALVSVVSKLAARLNGGQHDEGKEIPTTIVAARDTAPTGRNGDCVDQLITDGTTTVVAQHPQSPAYTTCSTEGCEGTTRIMEGKPGYCLPCRAEFRMERAFEATEMTWVKYYPDIEAEFEARLGKIEDAWVREDYHEVINLSRDFKSDLIAARADTDRKQAEDIQKGFFPSLTVEQILSGLPNYRRQARQMERDQREEQTPKIPKALPKDYLQRKWEKSQRDRELRNQMKGPSNGGGKSHHR